MRVNQVSLHQSGRLRKIRANSHVNKFRLIKNKLRRAGSLSVAFRKIRGALAFLTFFATWLRIFLNFSFMFVRRR